MAENASVCNDLTMSDDKFKQLIHNSTVESDSTVPDDRRKQLDRHSIVVGDSTMSEDKNEQLNGHSMIISDATMSGDKDKHLNSHLTIINDSTMSGDKNKQLNRHSMIISDSTISGDKNKQLNRHSMIISETTLSGDKNKQSNSNSTVADCNTATPLSVSTGNVDQHQGIEKQTVISSNHQNDMHVSTSLEMEQGLCSPDHSQLNGNLRTNDPVSCASTLYSCEQEDLAHTDCPEVMSPDSTVGSPEPTVGNCQITKGVGEGLHYWRPATSFMQAKSRWPPRDRRTQFCKTDLEIMESVFQRGPYPTKADRLKISKKLAIPESKIKVWFQNRRARERKKNPDVVLKNKSGTVQECESTSNQTQTMDATQVEMPNINTDDGHLVITSETNAAVDGITRLLDCHKSPEHLESATIISTKPGARKRKLTSINRSANDSSLTSLAAKYTAGVNSGLLSTAPQQRDVVRPMFLYIQDGRHRSIQPGLHVPPRMLQIKSQSPSVLAGGTRLSMPVIFMPNGGLACSPVIGITPQQQADSNGISDITSSADDCQDATKAKQAYKTNEWSTSTNPCTTSQTDGCDQRIEALNDTDPLFSSTSTELCTTNHEASHCGTPVSVTTPQTNVTASQVNVNQSTPETTLQTNWLPRSMPESTDIPVSPMLQYSTSQPCSVSHVMHKVPSAFSDPYGNSRMRSPGPYCSYQYGNHSGRPFNRYRNPTPAYMDWRYPYNVDTGSYNPGLLPYAEAANPRSRHSSVMTPNNMMSQQHSLLTRKSFTVRELLDYKAQVSTTKQSTENYASNPYPLPIFPYHRGMGSPMYAKCPNISNYVNSTGMNVYCETGISRASSFTSRDHQPSITNLDGRQQPQPAYQSFTKDIQGDLLMSGNNTSQQNVAASNKWRPSSTLSMTDLCQSSSGGMQVNPSFVSSPGPTPSTWMPVIPARGTSSLQSTNGHTSMIPGNAVTQSDTSNCVSWTTKEKLQRESPPVWTLDCNRIGQNPSFGNMHRNLPSPTLSMRTEKENMTSWESPTWSMQSNPTSRTKYMGMLNDKMTSQKSSTWSKQTNPTCQTMSVGMMKEHRTSQESPNWSMQTNPTSQAMSMGMMKEHMTSQKSSTWSMQTNASSRTMSMGLVKEHTTSQKTPTWSTQTNITSPPVSMGLVNELMTSQISPTWNLQSSLYGQPLSITSMHHNLTSQPSSTWNSQRIVYDNHYTSENPPMETAQFQQSATRFGETQTTTTKRYQTPLYDSYSLKTCTSTVTSSREYDIPPWLEDMKRLYGRHNQVQAPWETRLWTSNGNNVCGRLPSIETLLDNNDLHSGERSTNGTHLTSSQCADITSITPASSHIQPYVNRTENTTYKNYESSTSPNLCSETNSDGTFSGSASPLDCGSRGYHEDVLGYDANVTLTPVHTNSGMGISTSSLLSSKARHVD